MRVMSLSHEGSEKALHSRVVETIPLSRHTLLHAVSSHGQDLHGIIFEIHEPIAVDYLASLGHRLQSNDQGSNGCWQAIADGDEDAAQIHAMDQ
jgi:hypothetical protein